MEWRRLYTIAWLGSLLLGFGCGNGGNKQIPPKPYIAMSFFVSLSGNDKNPGTIEQPLATLENARKIVKSNLSADHQGSITVFIRAGVYELAQPLVFGPEDSGSSEWQITYVAYQGERVTLSGGTQIMGFQPGKGQLWTTIIPNSMAGNSCFRGLFVNDQRATRARTPNLSDTSPYSQLLGATLSEDMESYIYQFDPNQLTNYNNIGDVEVVTLGTWEMARKKIRNMDLNTGTATMAGPNLPAHPATAPTKGSYYYLENALEMLDAPGEWYLDRATGVISYFPLQGQDMQQVSIIAPRLNTLLELRGTPDALIYNLHFKGIQFAHTDWPLPPSGYYGIQACHYTHPVSNWESIEGGRRIDAAIVIENAESCSIVDSTITHLGGSGIDLRNICVNVIIQGNHLYDISANGIQIGGSNQGLNLPIRCSINNNFIHSCGTDYPGAVGIWAGFVQNISISHNDLRDLPYTGISMGWSWDSQPTACQYNLISYNNVSNVMKQLADGGGIYTLGFQPGTAIHGNHIHHINRDNYAHGADNNGLFLDAETKGLQIYDNVVYFAPAGPVRSSPPTGWQSWGQNYLSSGPMVTSDAAVRIVSNAGLEPPYQSLLPK